MKGGTSSPEQGQRYSFETALSSPIIWRECESVRWFSCKGRGSQWRGRSGLWHSESWRVGTTACKMTALAGCFLRASQMMRYLLHKPVTLCSFRQKFCCLGVFSLKEQNCWLIICHTISSEDMTRFAISTQDLLGLFELRTGKMSLSEFSASSSRTMPSLGS